MEMSLNSKCHVVNELLDSTINIKCQQKRLAQKSLFVKSFRCYQDDEYDGISVDINETNGQSLGEAPIYACRFGAGQKYGHILVLANEDGKIALRDTRVKSIQSAVKGYRIHANAIYEVCWVPGYSVFVSASGDQTAAIIEVREDGNLQPLHALQGHTRSVKTVHVNPFDPCVIATGSRDGSVIIWDRRCKPYHRADQIAPAHHNQASKSSGSPSIRKVSQNAALANNSVTGVIFQQQYTLISSGASDGLLKLWDLRKTHTGGKRDPQCQNVLEHCGTSSHRGFTSMSISPNHDVLYTSCMDNVIYAYHLANPTPKPVAEFKGHVNLTYFVKSCISPCGTYLLSGSSDSNAYVWLTEQPGNPVAKLTGHFAEVTSVAWCPVDDEKLVTCADDMKLRVFRRKNVNAEDFDERMYTRGISEQCCCETKIEQKKNGSVKLELSPDTLCKLENAADMKPTLPQLPATPSTSRRSVSIVATPSSTKAQDLKSPQLHPSTPQQHTPRHRHKARGRATPCTPKTGERNTLLQWLSSTKTPEPKASPNVHPLSFTETKKTHLKRKLTDLICEDQENKPKNKEKSPSTPPKLVLCASSASNTAESPSLGVAKMLKYGDICISGTEDFSPEENVELNDCLEPIEAVDKIILDGKFRKPVTNIACELPKVNCDSDNSKVNGSSLPKENASSKSSLPFIFRQWSSPTANLPNYVLDGSSPHNRPEMRREKKKNIDWLTSFSHQRKIKFSRTPDKAMSGQLGSLVQKRAEKKVLQIRRKPSVIL